MKNLFKFSALIACTFMISFSVNAQKSKKEFQGTVTYDITYPGATLDAATKSQLPTEELVKIKGCDSKTESTSGPVTQIAITNAATKSVIVLIDYMGTKYALKQTEADITASMAKLPMPVVNITAETKTIAGYLCKKAILTTNEEDGTVSNDTIYFTEELGCKDYNFSSSYKDVPGVVLEYSQYIDQISASMKYTARLVKKEKVADTEFMIPSDYQEVTKEELKKAFGG
jgi:GLPGLI family protein